MRLWMRDTIGDGWIIPSSGNPGETGKTDTGNADVLVGIFQGADGDVGVPAPSPALPRSTEGGRQTLSPIVSYTLRRFFGFCALALAFMLSGCADSQTTPVSLRDNQSAPATSPAAEDWSAVAKALGRKGTVVGNVYHVSVPRDDLFVTIEGMEVPTQAGLSSDFWFYRCSCGHISLVGQFTVADYESNDVIDALRAGQMKIAALAPILQYEKPHLLLIRFQGEGDAGAMAKTLREALRWTGKERMAPRKMDQ